MSDQKSQIERMLSGDPEEQEDPKPPVEGKEDFEEEEFEEEEFEEEEDFEEEEESDENKENFEESDENEEEEEDEGGETSEEERLRQQVNVMSKKLAEAGLSIESEDQPKSEEGGEEEEEEEDPTPKEINFLTEEELEQIPEDPSILNKVLQRVYNQARQDTLRGIPEVVQKTTSRQLVLQRKVSEFYTNNPDLAEYRDFVGYVANEIESENPDKDLDWIFAEAAKETRNRLNIKEKAKEVENERKKKPKKPAFPRKAKGGRRRKKQDTRTGQQKEIDEMLDTI